MKNLGKYMAAIFVAFAMITAAGCAAPAKQQTVGAYIDDATITTRAKAAILNEPELRVTEIKVNTFEGEVQLSGYVSSQAEIDRAMRVVRNVNGVKSVKNDMRLK
ncbi:MAG: BON domain-containing protein [Pseudomonadaceae bacterium]|nr:MAG: BON domain-containing protein [Pseudomonadaceae bacterium]